MTEAENTLANKIKTWILWTLIVSFLVCFAIYMPMKIYNPCRLVKDCMKLDEFGGCETYGKPHPIKEEVCRLSHSKNVW